MTWLTWVAGVFGLLAISAALLDVRMRWYTGSAIAMSIVFAIDYGRRSMTEGAAFFALAAIVVGTAAYVQKVREKRADAREALEDAMKAAE